MEITEVRLTRCDDSGDRVKAYGSITFDDDFVVSGIRLVESKDGNLFVSYPSRKSQTGEYKDVCFPLARELRNNIHEKVVAKYESLAVKEKDVPFT